MEEVFAFGWSAMKTNFLFFAVLLIFSGIFKVVENMISESIKNYPFTALGVVLIFVLVQIIISMIFTKASLQVSNNEAAGSGDFLSFLNSFFSFFGASILYGLVVAVGLILLIIPGIIWAIRFSQYGYIIIDKGIGPIQALKESWEITRGSEWNLMGFSFLSVLINLTGLICLIVGLFVSVPVTTVAAAYVYRKLSAQRLA
jgi:uncharacterized membrane protein